LGIAELALTGETWPIKGESAVALQAVAEGGDGLLVPTANGPEAAVVWESVCLTPLEAFVAVSLLSGYSLHAPLGRPHRKSPEAAPLSLAEEFMMALAYACRVLALRMVSAKNSMKRVGCRAAAHQTTSEGSAS
jgi:hypothetical protein